jgi:hypothetical protein
LQTKEYTSLPDTVKDRAEPPSNASQGLGTPVESIGIRGNSSVKALKYSSDRKFFPSIRDPKRENEGKISHSQYRMRKAPSIVACNLLPVIAHQVEQLARSNETFRDLREDIAAAKKRRAGS